MLYVASFSFDGHEPDDTGAPVHGFFTCVVESATVESAIEDLTVTLERLRAESDMFDGVRTVYLDSCVEAQSVPKEGFVAHFTTCRGEMPPTISTALQGANLESCSAYVWSAGEEGGEAGESDDAAATEETPFLVFESTAG